ncbi:hypothetical protein AXG93_3160s1000 [Marchantia polymorpha subsp. ruderalis]|uniref:Uncharacterized protein n=1 Tax=Marchantia polymorpha subsp. ruderalis TaxID=1480154 RepID=A0A176WR99_MARPO|nr:hypothetical protein AXG93_3160s1000 [Marchantia polymorpha subsp. ruderalis]
MFASAERTLRLFCLFSLCASPKAHIRSARITPARRCMNCFVRSASCIAEGAYPAGANYAGASVHLRNAKGVRQVGASHPPKALPPPELSSAAGAHIHTAVGVSPKADRVLRLVGTSALSPFQRDPNNVKALQIEKVLREFSAPKVASAEGVLPQT